MVEPQTFRFSGLGIIVRRIPFTSVTCIAALIRILMNIDERRRMRPKMRPPRFRRLTETLAYGDSVPNRISCDTRFRNGSSVTDRIWGLTRCFVSVAGARTSSHFALASRFARTSNVESGYTPCGGFKCRRRDANGRVPGPPPFLVLAALLVVVVVSMVALAPSQRDAVRRH